MIDFKEIPSNPKDGDPDTFEKFCSNFLKDIGYEIIIGPSRGPDGGMDLIVKDLRKNLNGKLRSDITWLVSCKHYAYSGDSVGTSNELNINDRLRQHECTGFIGFYSTGPSSSLITRLKSFKIPFIIYNDRDIENEIVGRYSMENLFIRFFPKSYQNWKFTSDLYEPVKLFESLIDLKYDEAKGFLITCFGSLGVAMKQIRQHSSFRVIFEKNNVEYIVNDEIRNITTQIFLRFSYFLDNIPGGIDHIYDTYNQNYPGLLPNGPGAIMFIIDQIMSTILTTNSKAISTQLLTLIGQKDSQQKLINFSLGINQDTIPNQISDCALFTNFFICSSRCHKILEDIFPKLKAELH